MTGQPNVILVRLQAQTLFELAGTWNAIALSAKYGMLRKPLLWFSPSDPELGLLKVPNCHFPALLGGYNPFSSVVKIEGKYKELNIARWTIVNRQHYTHKSLLPMGIIELWYFYSSFNPISQIFEKRRATLRMDDWNTMYKEGRKWKI